MYRFINPSSRRKDAETEVPIIPPTREKESKRFDTAAAVPATTREVMMTILHASASAPPLPCAQDPSTKQVYYAHLNSLLPSICYVEKRPTHVLCPRLNHVPTEYPSFPSATSRLVMRSMALIWSASSACLKPNVYASTAVPLSPGEKCSTMPATIHATTLTSTRRVMMRRDGRGRRRRRGVRAWCVERRVRGLRKSFGAIGVALMRVGAGGEERCREEVR